MLGDQASCLYTYFPCFHFLNNFLKERKFQGNFGSSVVRTLDFHCRGLASIPGQETKILKQCGAAKKVFKSFGTYHSNIPSSCASNCSKLYSREGL